MNPKISIIANFYNSKKYIPQLFKSVLKQTYTNWELICIDDCSPQNDHILLQKLTLRGGVKDKVKIIRNDINLGIAKSKKKGIDNATGEYITFIDGDDWFEPMALEKLVMPAIKYDLDLIIMNNYKIIPSLNYRKKFRSNIEDTKYNVPLYSPQIFEDYYINFFGVNIFATNSYWGKLYNRKTLIMSNISYPEKDTYEDNIFNYRLFPNIKSMMFIDYFGYNWRWGGITSRKKSDIYNEYRFIDAMNEFFIERIDSIEKYQYHKAIKFLIFEIKNVLQFNISKCAKYDIQNPKANEIISKISIILEHRSYDYCKDYRLNGISQNDFLDAMITKDAKRIYEICHILYKKSWKRRFMKNILGFFSI